MPLPLFVHCDENFVTRIQAEAGASALVTSSYLQGLKWISDTEVQISGIFFNPNDASYSALRFLGISLLQRPATPIFILDEENDLSQRNLECLSDKFKIKGKFRSTESFQSFLQPLQTTVPASVKIPSKRSKLQSQYPGYLAVPLVDFVHSKYYLFNVFVESADKTLKFFAMEGSEVDLDYLGRVSQKTSWLYVEESRVQTMKDAFHLFQSAYLDPDYLSPSWRSAETLFRAKTLLNELKKNGVSESVVHHTYSLLGDVFQLVGQLSESTQMRRFVDQAKQCDRTMACATLSILICKKLKFEKNTIVESLGVASFFQDVALYQSPFGNLSEARVSDLSEPALEYYFDHPNRSAELVSQAAPIPEVALQIIRQHHERIDRTGFPSRIGGIQLQHLAEILSLINSYLDHDPASKKPLSEVYRHYSERVVVTFLQLLESLKA